MILTGVQPSMVVHKLLHSLGTPVSPFQTILGPVQPGGRAVCLCLGGSRNGDTQGYLAGLGVLWAGTPSGGLWIDWVSCYLE